ncbi:transcriptional regulator, BadM/Rrf2 family [Chitinophaga costaii]|uniref:Transcriptional regulator, BadM/Rrf2 family n=1 Tax=Chitinophaga costaii TaxID=1335309 RepID=A0A1C4E4G3_9BACT|nr:Rrf2 family transcriptional regulator [Chitinophaga costaii]PUZ24327.1 Rrf2 family transcriptional regulator [Chitinophaga costaii]SCC38526.1 transcriptional regulator, BadM/Rrf2 family [Chitinophaga costaii]
MVKSKFAISVHILSLLNNSEEEWTSSEYLASSLNANPALVRKELGALRSAGLVESKEGKNGGSRLTRPGNEVLLSDIFAAIKEDHIFSYAPNLPSEDCPVGKQINQSLDHLFCRIDNSVHDCLHHITLADFCRQFANCKTKQP